MDQHYRFSGSLDQVANYDTVRVKHQRLDRAGGTLLPKKDEPREEKTFQRSSHRLAKR
jgi:hypothetical protein